jgi:hypothetical protein
MELLRTTDLFDAEWYLQAYPDVARAGIDPLVHFVKVGWREGRDPGPHFATWLYLRANPDVARSDVNPLCHYIEYGHAEGRGTFDQNPVHETLIATSFEFPPAAKVVSFPIPKTSPVAWRRSYRLDGGAPDAVRIGGEIIGYARTPESRKAVQEAFAVLAILSGSASRIPPDESSAGGRSKETLEDAWYVNSARLRTRWNAAPFPVAVRAYQHDVLDGGRVALVGEALLFSPLDLVDSDLKNPLFPLLFIFADPDGALRGTCTLAFPSLCRGGVHYPELLAFGAGATGLLEQSERLAQRALRLISGKVDPAVASIAVDLTGADGASPLFREEFKLWLKWIFHIPVGPTAPPNESQSLAEDYLQKAVTVRPTAGRDQTGATLQLAHDMVPTISALVAGHERRGRAATDLALPLLIAPAEGTGPTLLVEIPFEIASALPEDSASGSTTYPRLTASAARISHPTIPAAAIRMARAAPLTDAELLYPLGAGEPNGRTAGREAIGWLIDAHSWSSESLMNALECLWRQDGASSDAIAFIGPVVREVENAAKDRFARVSKYKSLEAAIAATHTPLTGHLGPGVLLHDKACTSTLARLLRGAAVCTASCGLVSTEKHGRTWHTAIFDAGEFQCDGISLSSSAGRAITECLWGSCYPVATPSAYLWVARSIDFAKWHNGDVGGAIIEGFHLCSAQVTASHVGPSSGSRCSSVVPRVAADRVTKLEILFG